MVPGDLLCALVAVYPPEGSRLDRNGALSGEKGRKEALQACYQSTLQLQCVYDGNVSPNAGVTLKIKGLLSELGSLDAYNRISKRLKTRSARFVYPITAMSASFIALVPELSLHKRFLSASAAIVGFFPGI